MLIWPIAIAIFVNVKKIGEIIYICKTQNYSYMCKLWILSRDPVPFRVSDVEGVALLVDFDFHLQHIGEANSRPFIGAVADEEAIRS
jgi:hypothetical protein